MRNAENKVIEALLKISKKFPSAKYLASAVETFGLFDGIAYFENNKWNITRWKKYDEEAVPFCILNKKTGVRFFSALKYNNVWECFLKDIDKCYVLLKFDSKTGNLFSVIPDENINTNFWKSDDPEERIEEVKALLED